MKTSPSVWISAAHQHGFDLAESQARELDALATWTAERATRLGLTNYRSPADVGRHALLPTFSLQQHLRATPQDSALAEIGPGSGVQGFALALLNPDREMLFAERRQRAVSFLELTRARLGVENVRVRQVDCAQLAKDEPASRELVMFRALAPAAAALPLVRGLLRPAGRVAVWHKTEDPAFINPPEGWQRLITAPTALPRLDLSLFAPI
jgi:16S rRNA G527 N7-methylase RsmG